nr:putative cytoplasmic protein [Proteus terrae subsp. cibarius]
MQISELAQGVAAKLEQSRIVFWYDPEQSFTEELEHLANALSIAKEVGDSAADITARVLPNDLTILNMGNESVLAVKKRIEVDEREAKFLIYFPSAEPEPDRDWLLDVRLYSEQFLLITAQCCLMSWVSRKWRYARTFVSARAFCQ